MKKLLSFGIVLFILLCGCSNQIQQQETAATTPLSVQTNEKTTTSEVAAEEEPEYDYSLVEDYCKAVSAGAKYQNAIIEFYVNYADMMSWENNDDISSGLSVALELINDDDGASDKKIIDSLTTAYEGLTIIGDPEVLPLLKECLDDYKVCSELTSNPNGTCGKYITDITLAYADIVTSHNKTVDYLYNIGYFSEDEVEMTKLTVNTEE